MRDPPREYFRRAELQLEEEVIENLCSGLGISKAGLPEGGAAFNRSAHSAGPLPQPCVFGFASRWLQCCSGRLSDAERYSSIKLVGLQQPLRGLLGLLQGLLGVSGGLLGAYWAYLSSLDCLRGLLGALGHLLGASWGPPGGLLGASWGDSGLPKKLNKTQRILMILDLGSSELSFIHLFLNL